MLSLDQGAVALRLDLAPCDEGFFHFGRVTGEGISIFQLQHPALLERELPPQTSQVGQIVSLGKIHHGLFAPVVGAHFHQLTMKGCTRRLQLPANARHAVPIGIGKDILVAPFAEISPRIQPAPRIGQQVLAVHVHDPGPQRPCLGVVDLGDPLGQRAEHAPIVDFLERLQAKRNPWGSATDGDERRGVGERVGDAGEQIRRARP